MIGGQIMIKLLLTTSHPITILSDITDKPAYSPVFKIQH